MTVPIKKIDKVIEFLLYSSEKKLLIMKKLHYMTTYVAFAIDVRKEALRKSRGSNCRVSSGHINPSLSCRYFRTDATGSTTYVNPWSQISGLSFEEALGMVG
jgi:hypothetical protein